MQDAPRILELHWGRPLIRDATAQALFCLWSAPCPGPPPHVHHMHTAVLVTADTRRIAGCLPPAFVPQIQQFVAAVPPPGWEDTQYE